MQQAKGLLDDLQSAVAGRVQQEKNATQAKVDERWQRLTGMAEFNDLSGEQQAKLQQPFDLLKQRMGQQSLIAVIRDMLRRFDETEYNGLLRQMTLWAQPPVPSYTTDKESGGQSLGEPKPDFEIVSQRTLSVAFNKALLADEADVDAYVAALRQTLLQAIQAGKRIQV
jgi:hypothetical protein